ncbi:MAG: phosphatidylserine decarboxylase family protein [Ignavibacteria bacterium]|nr:phosphatidylserine decarboxylase family protein [Bacteroidota bacterium]MSQ46357.1 phosphatidylserine decarboxylase family protein [Ignavibacteria bacterium]
MITEYGISTFIKITLILTIITLASWYFIDNQLYKIIISIFVLLFFLFTLNFFRDPERTSPIGEKYIISPADGEVIKIEQIEEEKFIKGKSVMISIFMSPLNVHVNRNPIDGNVAYYQYVPGEYFAAFEDKASLKNEQTHIGVENKFGKVIFKQIAGFVARRIICTLKVGDSVKAGTRFGMIQFGSRVDVYLPATAKINVKMNEKTVAGETILAEF